MSAQVLYQNISEFLSASPEWIKQWLSISGARLPKYHAPNPLMIPELIAKVIEQYEPHEMYHCYRINGTWNKEVNFALRHRQEKLIAKYKDLKKEYKKDNEDWENSINAKIYNNKLVDKLFYKMADIFDKKRDIFFEQVRVEICLKSLDLASADEIKEIVFHIRLMHDGFVPEDVELEGSDILDYWGDEDPDEDSDEDSDA
jgi:hypothetical protein